MFTQIQFRVLVGIAACLATVGGRAGAVSISDFTEVPMTVESSEDIRVAIYASCNADAKCREAAERDPYYFSKEMPPYDPAMAYNNLRADHLRRVLEADGLDAGGN